MPIVKCPSCPAKYDPGIDDTLKDIPAELSMKVVCPNCGQWLRLPEQEKVDAPNVPEEVLREMKSQSRLIELVAKPTQKARRVEEDDDERPLSPRRRDEDDDRPRRSRRDEEDDEYDPPRRSRRDEDDDDYDRPSSHRDYDDVRDDYDDMPPRRRSQGKPGDGLAIASMIVGICAVLFSLVGWCCCSYFGPGISVIIGAVAVVLGFIARSQGSQSGMGTAGIVTGFAAILLSLILGVLMIAGFAWLQANQGNFGPAAGGGGGGPGANPKKF